MKVKSLLAIGVCMCSVMVVSGQESEFEVSAALKTEGLWNMDNGETNLVNLIDIGLNVPLWKNANLTGNVLANQNTRLEQGKSWSVANDMQSLSNIQTDEQIPLSLMEFDITQRITDDFSVAFGIRNLNVDYFISPLTGLFTGSSHGIFPTIADNWNVGNYPVSALGLHLEWNIVENWTLKNSFYNGQASGDLNKAFRFRPIKDGVIDAFEVGYIEPEENDKMLGEYHVGVVYGYTPEITEDINGDEVFGNKISNISVFGLVEQPLIKGDKSVGLLLQSGYSPKKESATYGYFGMGLVFEGIISINDQFGVQVNRALYSDGNQETDLEITYSVPVVDHITMQPSLHIISTSGETSTVGLVRAVFEF